jgi:hypothetical protein
MTNQMQQIDFSFRFYFPKISIEKLTIFRTILQVTVKQQLKQFAVNLVEMRMKNSILFELQILQNFCVYISFFFLINPNSFEFQLSILN